MLQESTVTPIEERPSASLGANASHTGGLAGIRVLICEDEAIIQVQLRRMLTQANAEIVGTALNGQQGVDTALDQRPDLVLMDLNIPIIDGMEAARRIIAAYSPCVVILSAYGDSDFRKRAREIGVCGYITKPVTADSLLPELTSIYAEHLSNTTSSPNHQHLSQ